jgi:hypothetical protein
MSDYPRTLLEFQHLFDSVLKIAARVQSLTDRDFYESAEASSNPAEPDEPVLTG